MKHDDKEKLIFTALKDVETPEYDIWEAVKASRQDCARKKHLSNLPRSVVLAACLAVFFALGALAVELTVGWESFLGRTPKGVVTAVAESAVTGDYTLTLQEAIVDDDGAAFLLALTRNDGGAIEGDPRLSGNIYRWDVEVDGQRPNMGMTSWLPVRAEDGRTVYYCVEFKSQEPGELLGKTITFLCRGVADMTWTEDERARVGQETVSLAPLAVNTRHMETSYRDICQGNGKEELLTLVEELSAQASIPLERTEPGKARVSAVLFTDDDGPLVTVDWHKGLVRQGQYLTACATAQSLTDTRTGESWESAGYVWQGDENGFFLCKFKDCPLTEEDLPYVEVTVNYTVEKVLSDEPVELSFSADVGPQVTIPLDQDVDFFFYGSCSAHMTQARASALRLRLTVDRLDRENWQMDRSAENTPWTLVEQDGTQIPLWYTGGFDEESGIGWIDLTGRDENGDRLLITPGQVEALLVGDTRIPLI